MELGFLCETDFAVIVHSFLWIWETPSLRQNRFIPNISPLFLFQFMFGTIYYIIMVFETFSQSVIPGILQKLLFKQENDSKAEYPTPEEDVENADMDEIDQELLKKIERKKVKKRRRREKRRLDEMAEDNHNIKDRESESTLMENEEEFLDMNSAFVTLAVGRKKLSNSTSGCENAHPRTKSTRSNDGNIDSKCIAASKRLAIQGCKLAAKENHERAIDVFTKAIELTPDEYRYYGNRSFCFCQLGQLKRALKDAEKAISLAPDNAKGYFRKGEALRALKKFDEAKTAFEHVLILDKDCEDAINELQSVKQEQLLEMASKDCTSQAVHSDFEHSQSSGGSICSGGISLQGNQCHNGMIDYKMDPTNPLGSCSLWIGNISSAITEQNLCETFSEYGVVTSVRILPKKFCAFVNFQDPVSAGAAMKHLQRSVLGGERILIRFPDKSSPSAFKSNLPCTLPPPASHSTRASHNKSRALLGRNWNNK
ncbi:uncharacterized protein LOC124154562 [Ischnura elegans]|uniref:uncharacterized protein LOC124154562 n=1 Tax=Ischnura elegans TaxID=197161 RepID=UPI001ED897CD|nr:uncharacterized protein LOC124154562 [Ischnura elegans]